MKNNLVCQHKIKIYYGFSFVTNLIKYSVTLPKKLTNNISELLSSCLFNYIGLLFSS